ncbi:hypothetical protein [Dolichospermum phage Dfl-JY14]
MIVVKPPPRKAASVKSKARNIRDLADYVREVNGKRLADYVRAFERDDAKVSYTSSVGFPRAWGELPAAEQHMLERGHMIALANECKKSPHPIAHYVMSWQAGEQPTNAQADEAVAIMLDELGMREHQCIYAMHRDTDNVHLHIVVNRVHPQLLRIADPHNGFDMLAAHRALCRIEAAQGWQSEKNALYRMSDAGPVLTRPVKGAPRSIAKPAASIEALTGEASAQRIVIERCAPVIESAKSWEELHAGLAPLGARFEQKGSGAVIFVGEVAVKASTAGRGFSFVALCKRLGEYQPAPADLLPSLPEPSALQASRTWDSYNAQRRFSQEQRREELGGLKAQHETERTAFFGDARQRRRELEEKGWQGKGRELNAARSLLAAELARERAALFERQRFERESLQRRLKPFPGYEEWLREGGMDAEAEAYRFRADAAVRAVDTAPERSAEVPAVRDIRDYRGRITDAGVAYYRAGEARADFVDRGRDVAIGASDESAILAGLQLAQAKFGVIQLDGPPRAVRRAALIAAQHGIRLKNPELQELWEAEREQSRQGARIEYPAPVLGAVPKKREDIQKMADVQPRDTAAEAAYRLHVTAVFWERRAKGLALNWSAIDREAALRMRVTGHSQDDIRVALESLAPRLHPEHRDNWREYAERGAGAAFTPGADRELEAMQHMRGQLYQLESREDPESPRAQMQRWQREQEEVARRRVAEQRQGTDESRPGPRSGPEL